MSQKYDTALPVGRYRDWADIGQKNISDLAVIGCQALPRGGWDYGNQFRGISYEEIESFIFMESEILISSEFLADKDGKLLSF